MTNNKKAQILAAVMCASSVLGGYTVVSAQSFSEGNSTVSIDADKITASVNDNDKSTIITVGGNSLNIGVGENAAGAFGLFEINSKNFEIKDDVGLVVKDSNGKYAGGISNSGEIGGQGLTVITPGATTQIKVDSEDIYFQGNKKIDDIKYSTDFVQDGTSILSKAENVDSNGERVKSSLEVSSNHIILKSADIGQDGNVFNLATITLNNDTGNILLMSDDKIKLESKNGTTFYNSNTKGTTLINGGIVSASEDVQLADGTSLNIIGVKTAGITREGEVTTIEGNKLSASGGIESVGDVTSKDGNTTYSLNTIGANTQAINYVNIDGKDFTTFDSGIKVANDKGEYVFSVDQNGTVTSKDDIKASGYSLKNIGAKTAGITRKDKVTTIEGNKLSASGIESVGDVTSTLDGKTYSLNNIGKQTAGIVRDEYGTTTVEGMTSFDAAGMSMGDVTSGSYTAITPGNATFASANNGHTQINGGVVTASEDVKLTDGTSLKGLSTNVGTVTDKIEGIERDPLTETTTIEGMTSFDKAGMSMGDVNSGSYTAITPGNATFASANNGYTQINGGVVTASEDVKLTDGTSLDKIGKQTAGITRDEYGTTTIEGMTSFDAAGMSMGDVNSGSYTAITPGNATFASANKGITQINGGTITTNTIKIGDNIIDDSFFGDIGQTNANTAGITRTEINGDWVTSIEGAIKISESGYISLNADNFGFTYSRNDGTIGVGSLGDLANRVDSLEQKTQGISYDEETGTTTIDGDLVVKDETTGGEGGATGEGGNITSDSVTTGNITADKGTIGGITMEGGTISGDNANISNKVTVGGEGGTTIDKDGITVGKAEEGQSYTSITKDDVKVTDSQGNTTSLTDVGNRVTGLESSMNNMNNRLNDVEDRIDKVGAMAAAIANLRTMGFDPEAPTEIAIGVGQYKSETGLALGVFHYPNQDFMLSASISTSGDEVMGGIGATWKLGRKSAAEKAKDEEAKRLEKAEDMKKLAQEEKVKAQAERHAKLLAEREAQETA